MNGRNLPEKFIMYRMGKEVKLEMAMEQDFERILALQKSAFQDQAMIYNDFDLPPLTQTLEELKAEAGSKTIYKLVENGEIIASVRCFIKDGALYIEKLAVHPDFQNRGIGTSMLREIEEKYSHQVSMFKLFTGEKSERNLHLYKKAGYREVKRKPSQGHNFNLIFMEKRAEARLA